MRFGLSVAAENQIRDFTFGKDDDTRYTRTLAAPQKILASAIGGACKLILT